MNKSMWLLCILLPLVLPAQAQTTVEYIHTDALGSVVAVTDQSRNVIERREYEPYGAQLTPAVSDGPGYTGHVQDATTGLTYMQQRYYDPTLGRFLSVDPVTADASTGANFNRYKYAANNPYRFTDPDGRLDRERKDMEKIDRRSLDARPSLRGQNGSSVSFRTSGGGGSQAKSTSGSKPNNAGFSSSSIFTGDKKVTVTGVAALGSGVKAEKISGEANDKISFVTPALGLSAAATVNLGTVRYDWGGSGSALDAGVSGGGIRGGLGFAGGLQLNVDSQGIELQVSGGLGAGASADLYGVGYKPGADK